MPIFVSHKEWISDDLPFALRIDDLSGHILPHCHNYIEFNFTVSGTGIEKINGTEHELKPGTFSLFFPQHIHEIQVTSKEPLKVYVGSIRIESFYDRNGAFLSLTELLSNVALENKPYHYFDEETTKEMIHILDSMLTELTPGKKWSTLMFKTKLTELLITFDRSRMSSEITGHNKQVLSQKSGVWDIITYVSQNYQEDISLKSLSKQFHMSTSNISASFHQLLGENFHKYLEKIRLAHACHLLLSTDSSILDICFDSGFKSYKTFSRVFYNSFHISPKEYRKMHP